MNLSLFEAIEIGTQSYREYGYSEGPVSTLKTTGRRLQNYLEQEKLSYSLQTALNWVNTVPERISSNHWAHKRAIAMERAIRVMDEIICQGKVVSTMTPVSERQPAEKRISHNNLIIMHHYLTSISSNNAKKLFVL